MTDIDIIADLNAEVRRPTGLPCAISQMRRDRPDLYPHWVRVIDAKKNGGTRATHDQIANWFTERGYPMTRNVPERHVKVSCLWCIRDIVA